MNTKLDLVNVRPIAQVQLNISGFLFFVKIRVRCRRLCLSLPRTNGLFGSLERKESRREQRGREQWGGEQRRMIILHLIWMFLKLIWRKGVISLSSCLDVLKMRRERRENDLNKQIYPYLKIDLQHWSMINLLD